MSLLIPELEQQLRDVVRTHQAQGDGPGRRRMPGSGVLALAASVVVVLAVGAIVLLGARKQGPVATRPPTRPPVSDRASRQQLVGILAVLRRRPTKADLSVFSIPHILLEELPSQSLIDRPLVRLATTTSWGAKVFLVPYKPGLRFGQRGARSTSETLAMMSSDGAEWPGLTAATIEAGNAYAGGWGGNGTSWSYDGIGIVPNGVARVTVYVGKTIHAAVRNNVFAVRWTIHGTAALPFNRRIRPVVTWYAPSGHEIKSITPTL